MSSPFVVSAKRPSRCLGYGHISRSAKRVDNHPRRELKSGVGRRSSPPAPILKHWLRNGLRFCCGPGCQRTPGSSRKKPSEPDPSAAIACRNCTLLDAVPAERFRPEYLPRYRVLCKVKYRYPLAEVTICPCRRPPMVDSREVDLIGRIGGRRSKHTGR